PRPPPTLNSLLSLHVALPISAVPALQRMAPDTPEAVNLIRTAVGDRSRTVRLNALQALDVGDVDLIRAVLEEERDPDVRRVALQDRKSTRLNSSHVKISYAVF